MTMLAICIRCAAPQGTGVDARCPDCNRLVVRDLLGRATLPCPRCGALVDLNSARTPIAVVLRRRARAT